MLSFDFAAVTCFSLLTVAVHADTLYDNCQYHRRWNETHLWIHPRTCSRRLAIVRKLEPTEVDVNAFFHLCVTKWAFSVSRVATIRDMLQAVVAAGILGITYQAIKVRPCLLCICFLM